MGLFDDLKRAIEEPFKNVMQAFSNWMREAYKNALKAVWDSVWTPVQNFIWQFFGVAWSYMNTLFTSVGATIAGAISGVFTPIYNYFNIFYSKVAEIRGFFKGLYESARKMVEQFAVTVATYLPEIKNYILQFLRFYLSTYVGFWQLLIRGILELKDKVAQLPDFFSEMGGKIAHFFGTFVEMVRRFPSLVRDALLWLWNEIVRNLPRFAQILMHAIISFIDWAKKPVVEMSGFIAQVYAKISIAVHELILAPFLQAVRDILVRKKGTPPFFFHAWGAVQLVYELFWMAVQLITLGVPGFDLFSAMGRQQLWVTFLSLYTVLERMYYFHESLIAKAWKAKATIFAHIKPFTPYYVWYRRAIQRAFWMLGIGWLTWALFSPQMQMLVAEPIRRWIRERYQTYEPTLTMLARWYRKQIIRGDVLSEWFRKLGASQWLKYFVEDQWYTPPPSTVVRWLREGKISPLKAEEMLRRYGVHPCYLKFYLQDAEEAPTKGELEVLWRRGWWVTAEFWKWYKARFPWKGSEKLAHLFFTRLPSVSVLLEAYRRGLIDENTYNTYMGWQGYTKEWKRIFLECYWREVSRGDLYTLYEWGVLDDKTLAQELYRLGYRNQDLLYALEMARIKKFSDELKQLRTRIARLYALGYFTREEAMKYLLNTGYTEDQADIYLKVYDFMRFMDELEEYIRTAIALYRMYKIDESTMRLMLAPIVTDPYKLESIVALAKALRTKRMPLILPPVAPTREDVMRRAVISLEKQLKFIQEQYGKELVDLDRLIASLKQEAETASEEVRKSIEEQVRYLERLKEVKEREFSELLIRLSAVYFALKRMLGIPAGEAVAE